MEHTSIRFSKTRTVDAIVFAILAGTFYYVDAHLGQLPDGVRWLVFFPFMLLGWIAKTIGLREDHIVLYQLLLGLPPLIVYWYALYAGVDRWLKRRLKLEA